jgi:hypothetical protein
MYRKILIVSTLLFTISVGLSQSNKPPTQEKKNGSSIGGFFHAINNAGKGLSSGAKKTDENLKETSKALTKFSTAVDGYASDSLKRTTADSLKMKKPVNSKADSLKKKNKGLFDDVFKDN